MVPTTEVKKPGRPTKEGLIIAAFDYDVDYGRIDISKSNDIIYAQVRSIILKRPHEDYDNGKGSLSEDF